MYKIYKHEKGFLAVEILNSNEIFEPFNFTNLEKEFRECIDSQFNQTIFFNSEIPNCDKKFWKISNEMETFIESIPDYYNDNNEIVFKSVTYSFNKIVEMTQEEKDAILLKEENNAINSYYRGKKYKVSIANLGRFIKTQYQPYIAYCKERSSIITESITSGEGLNQITVANAYMDYIKGEELEMTDPLFATSDMAMILFATYSDGSKIFKLETNHLWKQ